MSEQNPQPSFQLDPLTQALTRIETTQAEHTTYFKRIGEKFDKIEEDSKEFSDKIDKQQHGQDKRISALERWRAYIAGGVGLVGGIALLAELYRNLKGEK